MLFLSHPSILYLHEQIIRTHTCAHMETHLPWQTYTLLPRHPILPFPLHYATSLIMAHTEEFGESSEPPSPAVARPSAITIGWHSHRQLPPLPWAPPLATQMPHVCTRACAPTCDYVQTQMCAHMPSPILVSVCTSAAVPSAIFEIHCNVLMVSLPGLSPGGKGWLLG